MHAQKHIPINKASGSSTWEDRESPEYWEDDEAVWLHR